MSDEQCAYVVGALDWVKSSYSDSAGNNCVEVSEATAVVHIRDSKAPQGPLLTVPRPIWTRFLHYATAR
jgi:hypothetical protein